MNRMTMLSIMTIIVIGTAGALKSYTYPLPSKSPVHELPRFTNSEIIISGNKPLSQDQKDKIIHELTDTDNRPLKGYSWIAQIWGKHLEPADNQDKSLIHLMEWVNKYTNLNIQVDTHLSLDDTKLFDTPFVYVTSSTAFKLTEIERVYLGEYLRNGGFIVVDNGEPEVEFGQAEASLRQMLRDALGSDAKFLPIENDHPIHHSFWDFDYGPPQGSDIRINSGLQYMKVNHYLEGIWLDERLVAVYSDKGYGDKWSQFSDNLPQLRFGVNMVVFAFLQEGGIVQNH